LLTQLRRTFQPLFTRIARALLRAGFTPNLLTVLSVPLAATAAFTYTLPWTLSYYPLLTAILILLAGLCDALDGALARVSGKVTPLGGFVDSLTDRIVELLLFLGIILGGKADPVPTLLALALSLLVSYARCRGEASGISMEGVGVGERAERILLLAVATLGYYLTPNALTIGCWLIAILAAITVAQRIAHVIRHSP